MSKIFSKGYKRSYSQVGEDLVVGFLLERMGVTKPFYVDIGSNDPEIFSNTYSFYLNGASGICVEPNPVLAARHRKLRGRDIVLQVGISPAESGVADYFVMDWHEFNTFDKNQAEKMEAHYQGRNKIVRVEKIQLLSVADLLSKHVKGNAIDFLSMDVEGMDLKILQSWDFVKHAPKIICVETCSPGIIDRSGEIGRYLISKNYKLVAENPINGIYAL